MQAIYRCFGQVYRELPETWSTGARSFVLLDGFASDPPKTGEPYFNIEVGEGDLVNGAVVIEKVTCRKKDFQFNTKHDFSDISGDTPGLSGDELMNLVQQLRRMLP